MERAQKGWDPRVRPREELRRAQIERRTTIWAGAAWRGVRSGRGARARATAHLEYERQSAGAFASLKRDGDANAVGVHLEATKDRSDAPDALTPEFTDATCGRNISVAVEAFERTRENSRS